MSEQNGHSTESVKEMVDLTKPAASPVRTVAPASSAAMPKSMPTPIRDLNVSQTFNITINLPQQVSGYPVQQVPVSVTQRQNVDIAWVGIAALFAALAVFAAMAWSFYQPFGAIGASAPIVRTSGTVDINQVAIGDQGIDWFNPVSPGVYQLRQNSTGLFVTQNGSTILVNSNGLPVFR